MALMVSAIQQDIQYAPNNQNVTRLTMAYKIPYDHTLKAEGYLLSTL